MITIASVFIDTDPINGKFTVYYILFSKKNYASYAPIFGDENSVLL